MKDIYDIKTVFDISVFSIKSLVSSILLFIIVFLLFLIIKKFYSKLNSTKLLVDPQEEKINYKVVSLEKLKKLNIDSDDFFSKISFIVRDYLESSGSLEKGTKKTAEEISKSKKHDDVYSFLGQCYSHEFSPTKGQKEEKIQLLKLAISIIRDT